jgi:uncharacterized protein
MPGLQVNGEYRMDIEEKTKFQFYPWLCDHKAEVIIAASTTFIMAGLSFQRTGMFLVNKIPGIMKNPNLHRILANSINAPIPQLLFFLILPVITLLILREPLSKYGFRVGDWKFGLVSVAICVGALAPLLYWSSTMPDFRAYYMNNLIVGFPFLVIQYMLYMFSWEFLLRGYLFFSLEEKVGAFAIWLQSVPFAISHLGKPAPEALTCYFGGLILGYIAMRSRSFLYPFLIHWGIYVTLLAFINFTGVHR